MLSAAHPTAQLLVVDDEPANLDLMRQVLTRAGYERVTCSGDPRDALERLDDLAPDLVLLDLHMPVLDGFAVLEQLAERVPAEQYLPRLVITADSTPQTRRRALSLGAHDFLTKPIDVVETTLRVANLLHTRALHTSLQEHNAQLEQAVRLRTWELERAQHDVTVRLGRVAEYRDDDTAEHTNRVGATAAALARAVGLPPDEVELVAAAAPLHDIGKVAVPDAVLLKPGPLTDDERAVMRTHALIGARILSGGSSRLVRLAEEMALSHHERWDGGGYPSGLAGEAIPLGGRLVAVADVFDALISPRPYKDAWPVERAVATMRSERGRHFDPQLLDLFLAELHHHSPGE